MGGRKPQPPRNVHGLVGVRGGTLCRRPLCRQPVDDHALGTLQCPNLDYTLSLRKQHKGASQSFLAGEIAWMVKLFQALRGTADVQVVQRMLRTPEAGFVQGKFIRMQNVIAASQQVMKETK